MRVPADKACIAQDDIQANLACLPVFLAGCKELLVLAGATYSTRLWYAPVQPKARRFPITLRAQWLSRRLRLPLRMQVRDRDLHLHPDERIARKRA